MNDTVKYNIGGTHYEVSRSLLETHSDTMLARSASDLWHEDSDSEIFIDRDGNRFRYVLDYMRDGRVDLPVTESKEALIVDLRYYNVQFVECMISNTAALTKLKKGQDRSAMNNADDVVEKVTNSIIGLLPRLIVNTSNHRDRDKMITTFKFREE
mmetsp:Transcript_30662/g.35232  ORF Transcript_30662/g.35232 Transcript_30662/m.35232 type:complete len:155 (-) Transcript_30662:104-568(-)